MHEPPLIYPYPGKMILFGEHTVLHGSRALAAPAQGYGGVWLKSGTDHRARGFDLFGFVSYLESTSHQMANPVNGRALADDLDAGYCFSCNIPPGYGLGSSGALCAALYDIYSTKNELGIEFIRQDLAKMESFFHGRSSGLDPLVSYTGRPILTGPEGIQLLQQAADSIGGFRLENTRMPRDGQAMISWFAGQMQQPAFVSQLEQNYLPVLEACINAFLADDRQTLNDRMFDLSFFQLVHFNYLIPQPFIRRWEEQLKQNTGYYKICGAGGGGFLLRYFYEAP